jgi:hypothetical protein
MDIFLRTLLCAVIERCLLFVCFLYVFEVLKLQQKKFILQFNFWSLAPDRHLFIFRFRLDRKSRQVQTCFPILLPFTCSRWRFSRPFPRALFYCFYVTLPLIRGPRNFANGMPQMERRHINTYIIIIIIVLPLLDDLNEKRKLYFAKKEA